MSATKTIKNTEKMLERLGNRAADQRKSIASEHIETNGNAVSFIEYDERSGGRDFTGAELAREIQERRLSPYQRERSRSGHGGIPGYKRCGVDFRSFLRMGMADKDSSLLQRPYQASLTTLARAVGAINSTDLEDGGFLVLPEYSNDMLELVYDNSNLWSRVPEYNPQGNSMVFPKLNPDRTDGKRNAGFIGYWTGEKRKIEESDAEFETTTLKLGKLCVAIFITEEMMDDPGFTLVQWITRHGSAEFGFQLGNALMNGIGGYMPLGFLKSDHRVVITPEVGQGSNSIIAENILKMVERTIDDTGNDDWVWTCNKNTTSQLAQLHLATGTHSGQLVYQPPGMFADKPYATLQGYPILPTPFNPVLGQEGDLSLINFKHYLALAKGGINQQASAHVEFLRDMNCIKFSLRVNGRPAYDAPIVPFKSNGNDHQSSCIVIGDRP